MAVKAKIKDLAIGSEFNAGPATLRILDHFTDGTTLVITSEQSATDLSTCSRSYMSARKDSI